MMASNGQVFWWTVAIITLLSVLILTPEESIEVGIYIGLICGIPCGIFFVICNAAYKKIKGSQNQFPLTGQRPLQTGPNIPGREQEGPRIVSITDRFGRTYQVPPDIPSTRLRGRGPGPSLQGIDYSQSECIVDLNPANFFCQNCGMTLCSSCAAGVNYTCPHCRMPLVPIRRIS